MAQAASSAALGAPLSWMDVIGGAEATVGADAVAEQAAQLAGKGGAVAKQAAAPPTEALPPAGLPPADKQPAQAFSWSDVIGGADSSEKSTSGEAAE